MRTLVGFNDSCACIALEVAELREIESTLQLSRNGTAIGRELPVLPLFDLAHRAVSGFVRCCTSWPCANIQGRFDLAGVDRLTKRIGLRWNSAAGRPTVFLRAVEGIFFDRVIDSMINVITFNGRLIGNGMTSLDFLDSVEIQALPGDLDDDGFVSIWNIASASCDGDLLKTRALAAQLLGFLCKKNCDFVVVSTTDAEYLDAWFERDNKLLYDWNPDSETVDVVTQHAFVPYKSLVMFLANQKFNSRTKHSPRRADRVEWFTNQWNVG